MCAICSEGYLLEVIALKTSKYWLPLIKKNQQVKGGDPNKSLQSYLEEIQARGKYVNQRFERAVAEEFLVDSTKEAKEALQIESGGEFNPKEIREKLFGKWEPNTKKQG